MPDRTKSSFWDQKAETFPRYEPGEDTYEAGMLRRIREAGVDFRGRTVLDVGSGSGMYTLRIARDASRVTAVDISARMLEILKEDAENLGIHNIDYVHSTWDDFQDNGPYDIVFCSMTPAIESEESRHKLLGMSGGWTVFMGFAGIMHSDMLAGVFEKYGATPRIFNNGPEMRDWLDAQGVEYQDILVDGQWVEERGKEETIKACTSMLIPYEVEVEREFLEEHIEAFRKGPDVYVERTDYKIELLIWRAGPKPA
ncbi:class I SAM-dependent methyltransferase [Pseudodesulfovibrio sp.]|uniref:class I SAM-dependent methyltransferase n=1 Tax=unclassified Pseudodesulfovibrio TaxID=2661612 RepID=UPI003B00AC2B